MSTSLAVFTLPGYSDFVMTLAAVRCCRPGSMSGIGGAVRLGGFLSGV